MFVQPNSPHVLQNAALCNPIQVMDGWTQATSISNNVLNNKVQEVSYNEMSKRLLID